MKYLKIFQTNADYQSFKVSSDWVTPNVSLIEEKVSGNDVNIVFEPFVNTTDSITFPVYLVEGDNGQLGIDVYNYLQEKYNPNNIHWSTASISELIYVNNECVSNITFGGMTFVVNIDLGFGYVANKGYLELEPDGVIIYDKHTGGSN